jgi:putative nucleotidyltransferase with HDIG domain
VILEGFEIPEFEVITLTSSQTGIKSYLVGGYVRDFLLQRKTKDIDITVEGSGIDFATAVSQNVVGKKSLTLFKNFGTAQLIFNDIAFEFVGARRESYSRDSRNPIVEDGTLTDDLSRRDFTINALAISLNKENFGELIDLFNGTEDLENKILRTPLDPDITFNDDPLRMMRGIRFASQLGFQLTESSQIAMEYNASRIDIITQERISEELNKIILSPKPSVGFLLLHKVGLLNLIFPEFCALEGVKTVDNKSHKDNFYHTLEVLDNISRHTDNLWLRWAAILHDIGKPTTQRFDKEAGWTFHGHEVVGAKMVSKIFKRMKLTLSEPMRYVEKLVMLHLRPIALTTDIITDAAIRRLIVDAGEDLDDLMQLCRADITSKNPFKVEKFNHRFDEVILKIKAVEERDALRNWKNPITGEIIMDYFKIPPGKQIGILKEIIKEAIMNGDIQNDFEQSFELMIVEGAKMGL